MFKKFLIVIMSVSIVLILGCEPGLIYLTLVWLVPATLLFWAELLEDSNVDNFYSKLAGTPSQSSKKRKRYSL